eukprot:9812739-Lingulodinium_polyedra.AAC.1
MPSVAAGPRPVPPRDRAVEGLRASSSGPAVPLPDPSPGRTRGASAPAASCHSAGRAPPGLGRPP